MADIDKSMEQYKRWQGLQAGASMGRIVGRESLFENMEPSGGPMLRDRMRDSGLPMSTNVEEYKEEPWSPEWDKRNAAWWKKTDQLLREGRIVSGSRQRRTGNVIDLETTLGPAKDDDKEVIEHIRGRPR